MEGIADGDVGFWAAELAGEGLAWLGEEGGAEDFFRKLIIKAADDEEDGDGFPEGSAHAEEACADDGGACLGEDDVEDGLCAGEAEAAGGGALWLGYGADGIFGKSGDGGEYHDGEEDSGCGEHVAA